MWCRRTGFQQPQLHWSGSSRQGRPGRTLRRVPCSSLVKWRCSRRDLVRLDVAIELYTVRRSARLCQPADGLNKDIETANAPSSKENERPRKMVSTAVVQDFVIDGGIVQRESYVMQ